MDFPPTDVHGAPAKLSIRFPAIKVIWLPCVTTDSHTIIEPTLLMNIRGAEGVVVQVQAGPRGFACVWRTRACFSVRGHSGFKISSSLFFFILFCYHEVLMKVTENLRVSGGLHRSSLWSKVPTFFIQHKLVVWRPRPLRALYQPPHSPLIPPRCRTSHACVPFRGECLKLCSVMLYKSKF